MHDRQLQTILRACAEEAAWTLAADTAQGAELPFDVLEERHRGGPTLYCYRPDTAGFIAARERELSALENWPPAVHALVSRGGLETYLRARGHTRIPAGPRLLAEAALRAFLEALFEDLTEFVLGDERFARVYGELEGLVGGGAATGVEVVVPLLGLAIESDELSLADGLGLARPGTIERVPEAAAWDGDRETVLAVVRGDDDAVLGDAPARVRRLVTALRLYDPARVAMGPGAWVRTAGGPWQVAPTGAAGLPAGSLAIATEQEDELRAFCNLVWRRTPRGGPLAWALGRFDMGCERPAAHRITDHLLALRALLEPEGADSGLLADRVAALCAQPGEHDAVAERIAHAVSLEQVLIAGSHATAADVELVASHLTGHLRAILRDVLCGHLDSDVRRLADELLDGAEA